MSPVITYPLGSCAERRHNHRGRLGCRCCSSSLSLYVRPFSLEAVRLWDYFHCSRAGRLCLSYLHIPGPEDSSSSSSLLTGWGSLFALKLMLLAALARLLSSLCWSHDCLSRLVLWHHTGEVEITTGLYYFKMSPAIRSETTLEKTPDCSYVTLMSQRCSVKSESKAILEKRGLCANCLSLHSFPQVAQVPILTAEMISILKCPAVRRSSIEISNPYRVFGGIPILNQRSPSFLSGHWNKLDPDSCILLLYVLAAAQQASKSPSFRQANNVPKAPCGASTKSLSASLTIAIVLHPHHLLFTKHLKPKVINNGRCHFVLCGSETDGQSLKRTIVSDQRPENWHCYMTFGRKRFSNSPSVLLRPCRNPSTSSSLIVLQSSVQRSSLAIDP